VILIYRGKRYLRNPRAIGGLSALLPRSSAPRRYPPTRGVVKR